MQGIVSGTDWVEQGKIYVKVILVPYQFMSVDGGDGSMDTYAKMAFVLGLWIPHL